MRPSLHHNTSNTSHMCPFPLLSACPCRHLYLYSTCFPVKVIWNWPDAKLGSTKQTECASFLLPWEVEVNTHRRALQRTNLEVMSRKTTRPPQLYSTAKKFAKERCTSVLGASLFSPQRRRSRIGVILKDSHRAQPEGCTGKEAGLRFTATTSLCPLSLKELRRCAHMMSLLGWCLNKGSFL